METIDLFRLEINQISIRGKEKEKKIIIDSIVRLVKEGNGRVLKTKAKW